MLRVYQAYSLLFASDMPNAKVKILLLNAGLLVPQRYR